MYCHAIWYAEAKDGQSNFLATLWKKEGKWQLEYRFRYYVDNKAHDSKDRKDWYTAIMPDDSEKSLSKALASMVSVELEGPLALAYAPFEFIEMKCEDSDPKFFFELASRPWAQVKRAEKSA